MPISRAKNRFFFDEKQRKEKIHPPQEIINKEGLGPSEVARRATSPDP